MIWKERAAGSHRLSAYFLSKSIAELPIRLLLPFLFLSISYPMVNMNPSPSIFFAMAGTQLLVALAGESVGLLIGTITMDLEKALMLATVTGMTFMLAGGFMVSNLPTFVHWIRYLSPIKYAFDACIQLEFDRDIKCNQGGVFAECLDHTNADTVHGQSAVLILGATESVWTNEVCLIVIILVLRLMAYMALRYMPHNSGRQ
jgi:ABC-type multidrug transport system permease subunit